MFIKEGIAVDTENKDALFRLLRFTSKQKGASELCSIEDYIENMEEGQEKIYFIVNPDYNAALASPYMEPFKGSDLDVLILTNNIDEILFQ